MRYCGRREDGRAMCCKISGTASRARTPKTPWKMRFARFSFALRESLSKMESETMLKIVTGEKPVEYFDEFASTWKTAGGDVITQEVAEAIK